MTEYTVKVYSDGREYWSNKEGSPHREGDLPARIYANGRKEYFINGRRHRENGPARIYADGRERYYLNDTLLTKKEFYSRKKPKHEGQVVTVDGVEYELKAKGE